MPETSPLRPSDPARLGPYRLVGRLGDGGQGVVYLGENPSGGQFAIKWLRAGLADDLGGWDRFRREVAAAQRVAAFCTAQIVETGIEQDRPYIVSEYIDGPSLQRLVASSGPRTGSGLHRLAVGTATALAAIHQAGIVHRDFKPGNVLMAADGPCVIDFGIARALDAATVTSRPVGTPSYMAPEQFGEEPVGPPADMFAWACTMVYAATGEPPFGDGAVATVIHRVLTTTPDLDRLPGTLREVVAACLDKDPANRPTAEQVLLRLMRQQDAPGPAVADTSGTSLLRQAAAVAARPDGEAPAEPAADPPPESAQPSGSALPTGPRRGPYRATEPLSPAAPRRSSRRRLAIAGSAAAVAVVLAVASVLVALNGRGGGAVPPDGTPTSAAGTPAAAVPAEGLAETEPPGLRATVYEHPGDRIWLAGYAVRHGNEDQVHYVRGSRTGPFGRVDRYWDVVVSPDGRFEAGRPKRYVDGFAVVELVDRRTGEVRSINTVEKPFFYVSPRWSADGGRLLLTMREGTRPGDRRTLGFIVVDVAAGTARIRRLDDDSIRDGEFFWTGDQSQVLTRFTDGSAEGLRFYDLDGRVVRESTEPGRMYHRPLGPFSPSGGSFVARCPEGEPGVCVWETSGWTRTATVRASCDSILGWYDDSHLLCWVHRGDDLRVSVIDLHGRTLRTLLKGTLREGEQVELYYLREDHG